MPNRKNKPAGTFERTIDGAFTDMSAQTATAAELEAIAQALDAAATSVPDATPAVTSTPAVITVSDKPKLTTRKQFDSKSHNPLVIKTESGRVKWKLLGTPDEHGFYALARVSQTPDGRYDISTSDGSYLIDAPMDVEKNTVFHGSIKFVRQALTSHYGRNTSASVKTELTAKLDAAKQSETAATAALAVMAAYGMRQPEQTLPDALAAVSLDTFQTAKAKLAAMMPVTILQEIESAIQATADADAQATADADASVMAELATLDLDSETSTPDA